MGETIMDIIFRNGQPQAAVHGGSSFNSIVSVGRAGVPCVFVGDTGADIVGRQTLDFMRANHVDTDYCPMRPDVKSAVSLAYLDDNGDASYVFYKQKPEAPKEWTLPQIGADDVLLYGSYFASCRGMRPLVEDMLTLFRAQKNAGTLPDTVADAAEVSVTAALRFEPVAFEAGHVLDYDIAPSLPVRGDSAKLGQALAVLLDNAVKYAAPGTAIHLDAARQGGRAVIAVANEGPDIPVDKRERIFDRFYRVDDARTDGNSFGLGLPIAKAIIDAHRGTLRCESGGGMTRFIISLPLAAGKQERGADHV